ncbi:MFS transporter [uncultured Friedmanniella sp.]|uniref:MFS transporter n=1 Tax=uncultured Friedmanniella sp. TaxID=335381 RepID=UPI0035CBF7D3
MPRTVPTPPRSPADTELGSGIGAYVRLLAHQPARDPFLAALVARLPIAMAPIGILLLVQSERGTYSLAGVVTGAYAIGSAVGTPCWGRLMDRFGQVRVLLPTALASASLLAALAVATVVTGTPTLLIALAGLAGFSYPPVSPAIRASWRTVFTGEESRRVAFALDATSVELIFVGGPLLLSILLALTTPVVPLLVTAAAMAAGTLAYCRTGAARHSRPTGVDGLPRRPAGRREGAPRSAATAAGVGSLLLVMVALSVGFGQLDTSMAATAGVLLGGTDRVGLLFAAIAGGSTVGGLVYGARRWPFDERRAVPVLMTIFAVLLGAMAVLMSRSTVPLGLVVPLLFCTGATVAPTLIMQQSLLDHLAPADRLNEAQSLLTASNTTGAAAGTALAGLLIDFRGLDYSFAGAGFCAALAAVLALASRRRWASALPPT